MIKDILIGATGLLVPCFVIGWSMAMLSKHEWAALTVLGLMALALFAVIGSFTRNRIREWREDAP